MQRIFLILAALTLLAAAGARAQDAAVEERLNKLSGQIEDLIAAQKSHQKSLADLAREVDRLREQISKPNESQPTREDLKRLADSIKEVDRKRLEDAEKIQSELLKIGKTLSAPPPKLAKKAPPTAEGGSPEKSALPEKFFEHTVGKGDTLLAIVQAYRDQNVKVTLEQIRKANPGLDPEKLRVGQKIIIPAP